MSFKFMTRNPVRRTPPKSPINDVINFFFFFTKMQTKQHHDSLTLITVLTSS